MLHMDEESELVITKIR